MALTKKYRVIWDSITKRLIYNPYFQYTNGSATLVGTGRNYFETDDTNLIAQCVEENELIYDDINANTI